MIGPRYAADALTEVSRKLGLRLVVLFGSRATGSPPPTEESDLDLAVLADPGSPISLWSCHDELVPLFEGVSLDLVVLNTADPLLRWEVMRQGVLLYGEVDDFHEYRAYAYRDFVDSADLRRLEYALFRKKLAYLKDALHGTS